MGSYTLSGIEFGNSCVSIAGSSQCTHVGCASGQQNSTADLTPAVGARIDDGPPTLTIDSPANLAVVGSDVTVTATVEDQFGDVTVSLEIVEAGQSLDDDLPPHSWGLTNIPDGMWTLRVTATDVDANVTMQEVVVCVGVDDCGGAVDTGGGSSSSSGGADGTSTTAAADSTGDGGGETSSSSGDPTTGGGAVSGIGSSTVTAGASGGFGGGAPDTGCACSARSGPGGVGVLLVGLLGLAAVQRRRRR
jgi:MYXO-CTERM domain-containing protein